MNVRRRDNYLTLFDLFTTNFLEYQHQTFQDLPDENTCILAQLIMWFPLAEAEVKNLKRLVRDIVDPDCNIGHVDCNYKEKRTGSTVHILRIGRAEMLNSNRRAPAAD